MLGWINFVDFISLAGHRERFDLLQPVSPEQGDVMKSWRSMSEDGDEVHLIRFIDERRFFLVHVPL